jgi:hypothetical protein
MDSITVGYLPARRGRAGGVRTIGEVLETHFGRFDMALRLLKLFLKCETPLQTQHHFRQLWKLCIPAIGEIRPTLLSMGDAHRGSAALLQKDGSELSAMLRDTIRQRPVG